MSGGEDGARYGPSLMPGGHPDAWKHIKPIFQVFLLFLMGSKGLKCLLYMSIRALQMKTPREVLDHFLTMDKDN